MRLRSVHLDDVAAYEAMRCDATMMADLGGPQPREDMPRKVARDVAEAAADREWIYMIVDGGPGQDEQVSGTVTLYPHTGADSVVSEIGWMVLPRFQGRGVGKWAVGQVLQRAAADGRWGDVHAWPAVTNAASNGICRALAFQLIGREDVPFAGQTFSTNHWVWTTPR